MRFERQTECIEPHELWPHGQSPKLKLPLNNLRRIISHIDPEDLRWILFTRQLPVIELPLQTFSASFATHGSETINAQGTETLAKADAKQVIDLIQETHSTYLKDHATEHLKLTQAHHSAHQRLTKAQIICSLVLLLSLCCVTQILSLKFAAQIISIGLTSLFFGMIWLRLIAIVQIQKIPKRTSKLNIEDLPIYSVLVPVFRETAVLPQLLNALAKINYPKNKLDIKLILEEKDAGMHSAISQINLPPEIEVLVVPQGKPQTKPRALNYALNFARGKYLTIYDAEDIPEPNQLQLAAAQFASSPQNMACLQAELAFYNSNENWLTRQFTIEYATLFRLILPTLSSRDLPLPLGGTSNHFRTALLEKVGGWDPYNVTEDADLGFRLARQGFHTATLDSITYEEANTQVKNWLHQRARWLKGFLQTWLVHMRNPVLLYSQIGIRGFATLQVTILGVLVSATLHPIFLSLTLYNIFHAQTFEDRGNLLGLIGSGIYLTYFTLGGLIMMFSGKLALRRKGISGWWFSILTMPAYWLLASLAGWIAVWQFISQPFAWNKTKHGLSKFQSVPLPNRHNG